MEVIGFILMLVAAVCMMISPLALILLSALGGGIRKHEVALMIIVFSLGCTLLFFTIVNSPISISLK